MALASIAGRAIGGTVSPAGRERIGADYSCMPGAAAQVAGRPHDGNRRRDKRTH